ncbi:quinone-dependent dihydroorotate dehydrogenase [Roseibacterium sp. SDUM158016]|uniref:quinone-dependent dihydroorotate dehydrogenase n=1 Tax=Roseicyclus sediminis TaxID=2980997 RepID=UPI0021D19BDC|nr:quinone-dependent dihydroorotate dehydrogenase [Roseibacterium sp. SDUM158016]MCU4654986.1 quinone-dependent dihydroorotate dehydrogenase [Roseibacterium sp. SDUM158016]
MWERFGLSVMRRMDPERAHALALAALKTGMLPLKGPVTSPRLAVRLAGMDLPNPVGLAAGFDKNAEAILPLSRAGFGFIEVGGVTPRAQEGNARPRLFRLTPDAAAINRFGFNNEGMEVIAGRLAEAPRTVPLGLNLGANKDSPDRADDFVRVLARCGPHLDFATVNVSSPNTERLRELQGRAALERLLAGVMEANAALPRPIAIFLKIAPDLEHEALAEIAEVAASSGIAGIIATNTTLSREGLTSHHRDEAGGLSGQPLFEKSTRVLAQLYRLTEGRMPLIGVGGVASVDQAMAKLRAGATAIQLYTGLVYGGITLGARIAEGLDARLAGDGQSVAEVTGTGVDEWL